MSSKVYVHVEGATCSENYNQFLSTLSSILALLSSLFLFYCPQYLLFYFQSSASFPDTAGRCYKLPAVVETTTELKGDWKFDLCLPNGQQIIANVDASGGCINKKQLANNLKY